MTAKTIFADLTNRQLVASSKAAAPKRIDSPANPGHGDKLYLSVQPLVLSSLPTNENPYEVIDAAGYSLVALVVKKSDGTVLSGPMSTWSVYGTTKTGSIDLYTAAMISSIGSALTLECVIEFTFSDAANEVTSIAQDLTVRRSYNLPGVVAAVGSLRPLTEADAALFVRWSGNPNGAVLELPSGPLGTFARQIYTSEDDGSLQTPPA